MASSQWWLTVRKSRPAQTGQRPQRHQPPLPLHRPGWRAAPTRAQSLRPWFWLDSGSVSVGSDQARTRGSIAPEARRQRSARPTAPPDRRSRGKHRLRSVEPGSDSVLWTAAHSWRHLRHSTAARSGDQGSRLGPTQSAQCPALSGGHAGWSRRDQRSNLRLHSVPGAWIGPPVRRREGSGLPVPNGTGSGSGSGLSFRFRAARRQA